MKKKWIWMFVIAGIAVFAVLCIPRRHIIQDGGSIEYEAVLYRIRFYHGIAYEKTDENGDVWFLSGSEHVKAKPGEWWYLGGTKIVICGVTVYDNTELRKGSDAQKPGELPTLILKETLWSGWSKEQPEPTEYTFETIVKGNVIYDTEYGTISVDSLSDAAIVLRIDSSRFVEPNENGTVNLTANPVESIRVKCGEEKRIVTQTLDGGIWLTVRYGSAPQTEIYRLIVNGKEVPIDTVFQESAKGEVQGMLPMTAVFRGIGYETEVKGDTVELRNGDRTLILDLNAHTLVDADKTWNNYLSLAPGDTGDAFKRQRFQNELWVCTRYVRNVFQLLHMPIRTVYDESNNEMRITIENTDG